MRATSNGSAHGIEKDNLKLLVVEPAPVTALAVQIAVAELADDVSVAVVHDVGGAVKYMKLHPVDVVITDLLLPSPTEGIRFCRWLRASNPNVPVLVFSAEQGPVSHSAAVNVGVSGYIHKSASVSRFRDAVKRVVEGRTTWWLGPKVSKEPTRMAGDELSCREREIHSLLLQRFTNAEIAKELCLAEQTVKNYVSAVLRKLGAKSRFEVANPRGLQRPTTGTESSYKKS